MTVSNPIPSQALNNSLHLELPAARLDERWRAKNEAQFSTSGAASRAWLNRLSLEAVQDWLQTDMGLSSRVWPSKHALPSQWEFINGTALTVNGKRWVLIPDVAIDQRELRVPQEWVDLEDWAADYYLAVQVNLDEAELSIWGYASHAQLKHQGELDLSDRTYSLDEDQLLSNIDSLCLAQNLNFNQSLRAEVAPSAPLDVNQAHQLIERLGQNSITFPRLSIPFAQWANLIRNGGWRQRLYERRQGITEQRSVLQWIKEGVSELGEQLGWQLASADSMPDLVPALAMRGEPAKFGEPGLKQQIAIADQALILSITRRPGELENAWRFSLCPVEADAHIPAGTILRLLSENLEPFEHNEDRASENCNALYVDVALESGEGIVWETDPTPEDYVQDVVIF